MALHQAPLTAAAVDEAIKALSDGSGLLSQCEVQHEALARKLRVVALAAARLGHRSCYALWGPGDACKDEVLHATVRQLHRADSVLVLFLDGDTLQSDDDAVNKVSQDMQDFLASASSLKLRQRSAVFRQRSFEFAAMMKFNGGPPESMEPTDGSAAEPSSMKCHRAKRRRAAVDDDGGCDGGATGDAALVLPDDTLVPHRRVASGVVGAHQSACMPPLRLMGGGNGSGAMHALHTSLVSLTRHGVGIVACIRNVARFGVWCDRMMYVLSGLMHDVEEGGAGMSLLLTSTTPDLRHTEKRLSSRLTCEMWLVPLPSTTVGTAAHVLLTNVLQLLSAELKQLRVQLDEAKTLQRKLMQLSRRPKGQGGGSGGVALEDIDNQRRLVAQTVCRLEADATTHGASIDACRGWVSCLSAAAARGDGAIDRLVVPPHTAAYLEASSHRWHCVVSALRQFLAAQKMASMVGSPSGSMLVEAVTQPTSLFIASGAGQMDLLDDGLLVKLGYASRESTYLLAFAVMRSENQILRTLDELIHDIATTLGTSMAIKSIVPSSYHAALASLVSLGILTVDKSSGAVILKRDGFACKAFLRHVFASEALWEQAGLSLQERHKLMHMIN